MPGISPRALLTPSHCFCVGHVCTAVEEVKGLWPWHGHHGARCGKRLGINL
jgi:hypothetical protein